MKLLRISSDRSDGVFENQLNADLVIEPNSQIALSNASFTNDFPELVLDGTNNKFQFQVADTANNRTVVLAEDTYIGTDSDAERLFQNLSKSMNDQLQLTGKEFGGEFQMNKNAGRVVLQYRTTPLYIINENIFNFINGFEEAVGSTDTQAIFQGDVTATGNDSCRAITTTGLCRGAGIFRATINTLATNNTDNNGFRMVLTETFPTSVSEPNLSADDDRYSVSCIPDETDNTIFKYVFRKGDGNTTDLVDGTGAKIRNQDPTTTGGFADATNDTIDIGVVGGKVVATLYQTVGGTATTTNIFSVPYDGKKLYPICIIRGTPAQTQLYNIRINPRQNFGNNPQNYRVPHQIDPVLTGGLNAPPLPPALRPSTFTLNMSATQELAQFIGFEQLVRTRPNYTNVCSFVGGSSFSLQSFESYVVEFRSVLLESFDGGSNKLNAGAGARLGEGGQFSILKVIPNYNQNVDNRVCNYEASNLIFIDMNNSQPILLRNISARILDASLSSINTTNVSILTMIIKGPNE